MGGRAPPAAIRDKCDNTDRWNRMVIKARYENGTFRPLEKVKVKEGTRADVYLRPDKGNGDRGSVRARKSVKDSAAYGIWKDRDDIGDGVEYVNRIRKLRK
jgi:predicted DNA-binding antitoxin AbrB/MazE fold protein